MKLKKTKHKYYCSDSNYYLGDRNGENYGRSEYDTWNEFKEEWLGWGDDGLGIDIDCNYCFRFDIDKTDAGVYDLTLFFMLQRKGIFRPVWIKKIEEEDMEEINTFLENQWNYTKEQWVEFSK